jgi:DNA-binding NarL/FixJ family response regulator
VSVLVVDDDPAFRRVAVQMLQGMGFTVAGEAGTAAGALRLAAELKPDAALIDIGLPDEDGTALAARLAESPGRPRILLISSDPGAMCPADVERLGAVGFVPKAELPGAPLRRLLGGA